MRKRVLVMNSKTSRRPSRRRSPPEHSSICASSNCGSKHITKEQSDSDDSGTTTSVVHTLKFSPVHDGDDDEVGARGPPRWQPVKPTGYKKMMYTKQLNLHRTTREEQRLNNNMLIDVQWWSNGENNGNSSNFNVRQLLR